MVAEEREFRDVGIEDQVQRKTILAKTSSLAQSPQSNSRYHDDEPIRQGPSILDRWEAHHPQWEVVTCSLL